METLVKRRGPLCSASQVARARSRRAPDQSSARAVLMNHRFTVEFFVASWEIECCAPPPVVGEPMTWRLGFATEDGDATPTHERIWSVARHETWTALSDGPIVACWIGTDGSPPPAGIHRLRGALFGTRHGGSCPDDVPETTGTVQRVRLASEVFRLDAGRTLRPIPGTLELADCRSSPRWFDSGEHPIEPGFQDRMQTGVLIEATVPE